jgi:hypothetical protein
MTYVGYKRAIDGNWRMMFAALFTSLRSRACHFFPEQASKASR